MTVPEACIKAKDEPPEYPWNEIVYTDCNGKSCLDDDGMRRWITWRTLAIGWMSTKKTLCSEKEEEHVDTE